MVPSLYLLLIWVFQMLYFDSSTKPLWKVCHENAASPQDHSLLSSTETAWCPAGPAHIHSELPAMLPGPGGGGGKEGLGAWLEQGKKGTGLGQRQPSRLRPPSLPGFAAASLTMAFGVEPERVRSLPGCSQCRPDHGPGLLQHSLGTQTKGAWM